MADAEEVVELDMPRPRSISRKPVERRSEAQEPTTNADPVSPAPRRQSDAQRMQQESVAADDLALRNITRDLARHNSQEKEVANNGAIERPASEDREPPSDRSRSSSTGADGVPDAAFRGSMDAVARADIEEVLRAIRADPDSSIRQETESSDIPPQPALRDLASNQVTGEGTSRETLHQAPMPAVSEAGVVPGEVMAMMADMQLNPTHDQQYATHYGSRGISPPPGFEDATVPAYQDSTAVPSYQNVISQPPGLALSSANRNRQPNETLAEVDRPSMTDKFMSAHIARHGNSSLSPLALLTPDQTDTLPEYVQSTMGEPGSRGRSRQERPLPDSAVEREAMKVIEALETVRAMEEQEALEAIENAEASRSSGAPSGGFEPDQLLAIRTMGEEPGDYYAPEDLAQYQRLSSDPSEEGGLGTDDAGIDEAELLQMMAHYARRPEPANAESLAENGSDLDELESMLRDRILTNNSRSIGSGRSAAGQEDELAIRLLKDQNFMADASQAQSSSMPDSFVPQPTAEFVDPQTRSGVNVFAVAEHASARNAGEDTRKETPERQMPSAEAIQEAQSSAAFGGGHGVKRTIVDPATRAAQLARNAKKAEAYAALQKEVDGLRQAEIYSDASFDLTTKLLMLNPEYYTIWNYRRNILMRHSFPSMDDVQRQELIDAELKRLQGILKDYPKVYWIWNHRKWCLAQCPWPDWSRELLLVTKMLEQDARNFHVWEYRRYVVAQTERLEETSKAQREFEYTTAAINSNFSNFSAWHNRTKLIPQMLQSISDEQGREVRRREMLSEELELIKGAIYTDPDDQSVWLYHRWLLNPDSAHASLHPLSPSNKEEHVERLSGELEMIAELLEEEPENSWCMYAKVHYQLSLNRLTGGGTDAADSESLKSLMQSLEGRDSLRSGRYAEWQDTHFPSANKSTGPADDDDDDQNLEFKIFSDLKARPDFSRITLSDSGTIAAFHEPSGSDCLVVPRWAGVDAVVSRETAGRTILVASAAGGDGDEAGIAYFRVSRL